MAKRNRKLAGLPKQGRPSAVHHGTLIPLTPVHGVTHFTAHTAERFRQRTGFNKDAAALRERLEEWLHRSRPAKPNGPTNLLKLLRNGCRPNTYRIVGDPAVCAYVMVIEAGILVTVHLMHRGTFTVLDGP